ncbi:MAG TPA: FAD-binding oxidoreductase [Patescibacteria group bacterium]|nr:FAD-binding oxidoreductase [Patescibacteria group bacterium]
MTDARLSNHFDSKSDKNTYDKIIIGGGPAGLFSAYEILAAAKAAGKPVKVAVLTDTIHSPSAAGSNIVFGIDGYETSDTPLMAQDHAVLKLVRDALPHLQDIVRKNKIDCRLDMNYQLIGSNEQEMQGSVEFLENRFDYRPSDFHEVAAQDRIKFKGTTMAIESNTIGELNVEELEQGLVKAIKSMGGEVVTSTHYLGHEKTSAGFSIETDKGEYTSSSVPLIATGPALAYSHQQLPAPIDLVYTGAMHIPLLPEDAAKVSRDGRPMGFADTHLDGDVLWGGLDSKGVLTIGFGDSKDPNSRTANEQALRKRFAELLPELAAKYAGKESFSFGPMLKADNMFPFVGRLGDCDINTAWASRGIVQSLAAAQAYADYFVNGNDRNLKLFERLNPAKHSPVIGPKTEIPPDLLSADTDKPQLNI